MSSERILRLKRAEDAVHSFVLLHVVGEGNSPLGIKLTASDGEQTFRITIKLDQVSKFRDSLYGGTDNEFGAVVRKSLLLESQPGSLSQDLERTEFVAEIPKLKKAEKKKPHMSLIWRRKLGDINQKLGQIDLPEFIAPREEDEINAYEWAETAARNFDDSRQHVENLETQLATQTETILKLQSQLDSIVQAKVEQEGILLHKFTELINSKKVKIRDQQRLLGTAKVDPDALARIAPLTSVSHKATESRSSKRKAKARAEPSDDESSDAFEDAVSKDHDQEMEDVVTPEDTEDDTEEDEAEKPAPSPVKTGIRRRIGGRASVVQEKKTKTPEPGPARSTRGNSKSSEKAPEDDIPPPRRELPFGKKKTAKPEPKAADDDETDDDEL